MKSVRSLSAGNGIALFLTIVCLLPIVAILALIVTSPLDSAMANLGLWMRETFEWIAAGDTNARFEKIGFAIRIVFIAVGLSFYISVSVTG